MLTDDRQWMMDNGGYHPISSPGVLGSVEFKMEDHMKMYPYTLRRMYIT